MGPNNAGTCLNAHEAPPQQLKAVFKKYQKLKLDEITQDENLEISSNNYKQETRTISSRHLRDVFAQFLNQEIPENDDLEDVHIYSSEKVPGLLILPSLIPPVVQQELLSRLLHRDLSNSDHKTNLHMHYFIPYPDLDRAEPENDEPKKSQSSFFVLSPNSTTMFQPKDPGIHKPLTIGQVLEKKLRWVTLGGQYDWTNKVYPDELPPDFPADIAAMVGSLFPEMEAQAAIVNLYSPGDTLSLHRDVSEKVDRGLASISLGCDCIFIIGLSTSQPEAEEDQAPKYLAIRLRSGDAVYMSKESRFAWHGVPRIISNTCPGYLSEWPAQDQDKYAAWRGWMQNKRINLNVRQMH
ncbi:oxidoreductase [Xylogone sp. PMI_703]|nr:oxidoreductase [Xylogone sp. PMI_703]